MCLSLEVEMLTKGRLTLYATFADHWITWMDEECFADSEYWSLRLGSELWMSHLATGDIPECAWLLPWAKWRRYAMGPGQGICPWHLGEDSHQVLWWNWGGDISHYPGWSTPATSRNQGCGM